jgi:hypothetical protein
LETAGELPNILKESIEEYTQFIKGKPKDVNMQPVGLANTRISTDCAQTSSLITDVALLCKCPRGDFWV